MHKNCFSLKSPVQLPLHEPYFDLTLISGTHTKNPVIAYKPDLLSYNRKANLLSGLLSACDEWLVPIRNIIHRVMVIHDYQQFLIHIAELQTIILILFYPILLRFAKIRIFASLCLGKCGTSIAHNIKAMMTCLDPFYHYQYKGELLYFYFYYYK